MDWIDEFMKDITIQFNDLLTEVDKSLEEIHIKTVEIN